nr:Rho guanine nucleotide exchange factor like [Ipomoea batatas]
MTQNIMGINRRIRVYRFGRCRQPPDVIRTAQNSADRSLRRAEDAETKADRRTRFSRSSRLSGTSGNFLVTTIIPPLKVEYTFLLVKPLAAAHSNKDRRAAQSSLSTDPQRILTLQRSSKAEASFRNRSVECTSTALVNQPKAFHSLCFLLSLCNGQSLHRGEQPVDSDFACIDCKRVLPEQQIATEPVKEEPENPPVKSIKSKKMKESKAKKPSAPRKRNPLAHPPNFEMVQEAVVTLKERTGSSQYAIQKFIVKKQKTLLSNFRKLLLFHLKKFVAVDMFMNVKNSAVSLVLTMMFYGFKEIFTYRLSSFFLELKNLVKMHLLILDCLSILILFKVIGNSVAMNSCYGSAEEVACDSDSVSSGSGSFLTRGLVMVFGYECVHIQRIIEASGTEEAEIESETSKIAVLLHRFLALQQRRAQAYARLKMDFEDYMVSGVESTYRKLCSKIAVEFNDCSKQVLEMESQFLSPDCFIEDLAALLRFVQTQEKQKLELTATTQVLKMVSHENCRFSKPMGHECYAYPDYECFKDVELNKLDIQQLQFWCQYWIIVATMTACEKIADTFISWVPILVYYLQYSHVVSSGVCQLVNDIELLVQTCMTTLSSKIVNRCKHYLAEIAVKDSKQFWLLQIWRGDVIISGLDSLLIGAMSLVLLCKLLLSSIQQTFLLVKPPAAAHSNLQSEVVELFVVVAISRSLRRTTCRAPCSETKAGLQIDERWQRLEQRTFFFRPLICSWENIGCQCILLFYHSDHQQQSPPRTWMIQKASWSEITTPIAGLTTRGYHIVDDTLVSKSESVIQNCRRNLEEFSSVASRAIQDLPAHIESGAAAAQESLETVGRAIDDIGSSVAEIIEPEDFEDYNEWKLGFVFEEKLGEMGDLVEENNVIGEIYSEIVPSKVDGETFWSTEKPRAFGLEFWTPGNRRRQRFTVVR